MITGQCSHLAHFRLNSEPSMMQPVFYFTASADQLIDVRNVYKPALERLVSARFPRNGQNGSNHRAVIGGLDVLD